MGELRHESRMSDSDALMWTIEKDAMLRSTITAIAVLDRAPDHDRLRHLLDRGTRLVPRLRRRVRANPLLLSDQDDRPIGVDVDPAAVAEPDRLVDASRAGWAELLAVA